jgi:hypothetical protein
MEELAKQQAAAAALAAAQSTPPAQVSAVAVKLPPFWVDNAEVWFLQAEAQFAIAGITSERTAFYHVLAALPQHVVVSVLDVVRAAGTAAAPFTDLKTRLLGGYTQTKWARMFQLIHHPGLGDQRPSQLMDKMLALLSAGTKPDEVFMGLFMDRLPVEMRAQLSLQDYESPRHLAAAADLIWDARGPTAAVPPAVNAVMRDGRNRSRSPSGKGGRGGGRRNRASTPGPGLCFFHRRFAEKAHRCEPPCTWAGNAPAAPAHN